MLATVKGYYDKGMVFLSEEAPVSTKTEVIVTFLSQEVPIGALAPKTKRKLGSLEGKIVIPDDFNEPTEDLNEYM